MDMKIYTCNYLNHGVGVFTSMYLNKKQINVFPVSAVVQFYSFSTVHIKDQKTSEYNQEIPQSHKTKTRPYIIMHFIKQPNQLHFECKLYVQKCVSVSVPFVPNSVVEHVSGFVVCCVQTTHYK